MTSKPISKVLEIDNCNKDELLKSIYKKEIWEALTPVKKIEVEFLSPNVFHSEIMDEVKLVNFPIEMKGELVLMDKGEQKEKGRLVEFNVRNNENVKELEGNIRMKILPNNKLKIGVFVHKFTLNNDFMNSLGKGVGELILRTKLNDLLRNLEKYCKTHDSLEEFL